MNDARMRIIDVKDKWNSLLADVTFDWHHVVEAAVVRNDQICLFISFFSPLVLQDLHQNFTKKMNKNDVKTKCKYKLLFYFFLTFIEVWM